MLFLSFDVTDGCSHNEFAALGFGTPRLHRTLGAVSPVHIRSSCLSNPTVSDRYFAGAYTRSLGQSARYRPLDILQSTVASPGCSVRIEIPPARPLRPPCPNKPLPPYVQS